MLRFIILAVVGVMLTGVVSGAALGTYYVDSQAAYGSGVGTKDNPFAEISEALDLAEDASGTNAYIVYVKSGTYTEANSGNQLNFELNAGNDQIQMIGVTDFDTLADADGAEVTVSCSSTQACFNMTNLVGNANTGSLAVRNIRFETAPWVDSDNGALMKSNDGDNDLSFYNCQFARVNPSPCNYVWGVVQNNGGQILFQDCEFIDSDCTDTLNSHMLLGNGAIPFKNKVEKIEFNNCTIGKSPEIGAWIQIRAKEVLIHHCKIESTVFSDPYCEFVEINNNVFTMNRRRALTIGSSNNYRTITAITAAQPPVVTTASSHGFSNGDKIRIGGVGGMTQLNIDNHHEYYVVANKTANTLELCDRFGLPVNAAGFGAYTSGGHAGVFYPFDTDIKAVVYNNYFEEVSGDVLDYRAAFLFAYNAHGLVVYGNRIENAGGNALWIATCDGALIMNNYIESGRDPISLLGSHYCHIVNNEIVSEDGACVWWGFADGNWRGYFSKSSTCINNEMISHGSFKNASAFPGVNRGPLFFADPFGSAANGTEPQKTNHFIDYNSYWSTENAGHFSLALIGGVECDTIAEIQARWAFYMDYSSIGYDEHSIAGIGGHGMYTDVDFNGNGFKRVNLGVIDSSSGDGIVGDLDFSGTVDMVDFSIFSELVSSGRVDVANFSIFATHWLEGK